MLDSGADHTVVREDLVSHHEYTGKTSTVGDYFGYWRKVPTALVWIGIEGEYKFCQEVLVVPRDCAHQVLLGNDIAIFDDLYTLAIHKGMSSQVRVVTRAETQRRAKRLEIENVQDGARPLPITLAAQSPPLRTPSKRSDCSETQRNVVDMREDKVGDREVV